MLDCPPHSGVNLLQIFTNQMETYSGILHVKMRSSVKSFELNKAPVVTFSLQHLYILQIDLVW